MNAAVDKAAVLAEPSIPILSMRPREAAKALGLGERKLWELTNRGIVPHIKIDKVVMYSVDALRTWLIENSSKGDRP